MIVRIFQEYRVMAFESIQVFLTVTVMFYKGIHADEYKFDLVTKFETSVD